MKQSLTLIRWKQTASALVLTMSLSIPTLAAQIFPSSSSSAADIATNDPTNEQDRGIYCASMLETILPGDFYACEARRDFAREKIDDVVDDLTEASYWANKDAQYALGLMYVNGDTPGVSKNLPLGLAWLWLSAERKNQTYIRAYAIARARATPYEAAQAATLLKKMRARYSDPIAAVRAARYFNHAMQNIDEGAMYGGIVYMKGMTGQEETAIALSKQLHAQADTDFEDWHGTVTVGQASWTTPQGTDPAHPAPAHSASTSVP